MADSLTSPIDTQLQRDALDIALRKLYDLRDDAKRDRAWAERDGNRPAELTAIAKTNALNDAILAVNDVQLDLLRAEVEAIAATRRAMGVN